MFRSTLTKSTIYRSVIAARQLHASPVVGKSVTEKVTDVAGKVNKSVGKGLAGAIDSGEKVMDSTKQSLGSAKRKATDATEDAQGMAKEKVDEASKSTKQAAESTRQKFNQATAEAGNKSDRVRLFPSLPPLSDA
ncbi:hypothetical protein BJ322DRAFT_1107929 [Thelephora terrestris]|uniref:Uncharacterized protein n=1 Tax=Thelephora terrestris TaxID=56493 RepID=A0A9P6HFR0_9AGAM|nr:hypothetical protein BJ322DRAFT_1107929 [Thelephora terrestris]